MNQDKQERSRRLEVGKVFGGNALGVMIAFADRNSGDGPDSFSKSLGFPKSLM